MKTGQVKYLFFINIMFLMGQCFNSFAISLLFSCCGYILLLMYAVTRNKEEALGAAFFFAPSQAIVGVKPISFGLLGIYILFVFIIKGQRIYLRNTPIFSICFLLLLNIMNYFRTESFYDLAIVAQAVFICLFLISYNFNIRNKGINTQKYVELFIMGTLALIFDAVIYALNSGVGMFERMGQSFDNANYLAVTYAISSLICFIRFLKENRKSFLVLAVIFLLTLLVTGSRGGLLAFGIGLLWYFVSTYRMKMQYLALMLVGVIFLILVFYSQNSFFINIRENLIFRTLEGITNASGGRYTDVSSGRIYLWGMYWEYFGNDIITTLFGYGMYDYAIRITGQTMIAHSIFISTLLMEGLVGSFCIVKVYYKLYHSYCNKLSVSAISIIITALVGYAFLDGTFDIRMFFYFLIPGYYLASYIGMQKKNL